MAPDEDDEEAEAWKNALEEARNEPPSNPLEHGWEERWDNEGARYLVEVGDDNEDDDNDDEELED
jgi:hypothetical protein